MSATPTIASALAAMRDRRAVLIGDLVLDAYVYGETVRVSREAPVLVVRKEREEYRLGGAANAAANLAALGVRTALVGVVGKDEIGARLVAMLSACGVDTSRLEAAAVTTPVKTRILAGAFGTARQQVLRIDEEPEASLSEGLAARLATALKTAAAPSDVVVVSDYGLGALGGPVVQAVGELAQGGARVCVDSRNRLDAFPGVTVIKPNLAEAAALVGYPLSDAASLARAGAEVVERLQCRACLVTEGQAGMTLFEKGAAPLHVTAVGGTEVTDVTGAGDTVIAVLAAAVAAGLGMANAMRLANCAAGVVVMKAGAATATPAEIEAAATRGRVTVEPW